MCIKECCQTSKIEIFAKIVNGFQLLTNTAKHSENRCMTGFWIHFCWPHQVKLNPVKSQRENIVKYPQFLFCNIGIFYEKLSPFFKIAGKCHFRHRQIKLRLPFYYYKCVQTLIFFCLMLMKMTFLWTNYSLD